MSGTPATWPTLPVIPGAEGCFVIDFGLGFGPRTVHAECNGDGTWDSDDEMTFTATDVVEVVWVNDLGGAR